eukprot:Rmarinus@m.3771
MEKVCNSCGSTDIEIDGTRGDAVCTRCGNVLEESAIVNEVSFQENSAGQSSVIGQFVSAFGPHGSSERSGRGRRIIQDIAGALRLPEGHVEQAHRLFMLAIQHNFIQGRKTENVASACLYTVCRRAKSPHMLIDFSDVLQTNVYELGQTFLRFMHKFHISLPVVDPALFIHRFASKLEFEDKTHTVAQTALQIVKRMERDWLVQGRLPGGVCAAGLLLAARMFGFKRSIRELVGIVRVGESTVRRRLQEFAETEASKVSLDDFDKMAELPQEKNPPSFDRLRKMADKVVGQEAMGEGDVENEIADILRHLAQGKVSDPSWKESNLTDSESEGEQTTRPGQQPEGSTSAGPSDDVPASTSIVVPATPAMPAGTTASSAEDPREAPASAPAPLALDPKHLTRRDMQVISRQDTLRDFLLREDREIVDAPEFEDQVSDVDDEEIRSMILSEAEAKAKAELWQAEHGAFVLEQEEKRRRAAELAEEKPKKRRRRKKDGEEKGDDGPVMRFSKNINYQALNDLLTTDRVFKKGPPVVARTPLLTPSLGPSSRLPQASLGVSASPMIGLRTPLTPGSGMLTPSLSLADGGSGPARLSSLTLPDAMLRNRTQSPSVGPAATRLPASGLGHEAEDDQDEEGPRRTRPLDEGSNTAYDEGDGDGDDDGGDGDGAGDGDGNYGHDYHYGDDYDDYDDGGSDLDY